MWTTCYPRERLGTLETREDRLVEATLDHQKSDYLWKNVDRHPEWADTAREMARLARRLEAAAESPAPLDATTRALADEHYPSTLNQYDHNTRRAAQRARRALAHDAPTDSEERYPRRALMVPWAERVGDVHVDGLRRVEPGDADYEECYRTAVLQAQYGEPMPYAEGDL